MRSLIALSLVWAFVSRVDAADPKVAMADMKEVHIFIENFSLASGKMPPPRATLAALIEAKAKAADAVKSGAIVLTGATMREAVWAFEKAALANGGLAITQNGVETLTADEPKKRLGTR